MNPPHPKKRRSFGFNHKTARKYDLQGTLDTVFTLVTPTGLQFAPIQLDVKVPFKLPSIIENGVNIKPNERFFIDFDYRFYRYGKALDKINVLDKQSGTILAAQNLNAKNVHLFLVGGAYSQNQNAARLFILLFSLLVFTGTTQAQTLKADYQFQGNLNRSVADAPAMTNLTGSGDANSFVSDTIDGYAKQSLRFPFNSGLWRSILPA